MSNAALQSFQKMLSLSEEVQKGVAFNRIKITLGGITRNDVYMAFVPKKENSAIWEGMMTWGQESIGFEIKEKDEKIVYKIEKNLPENIQKIDVETYLNTFISRSVLPKLRTVKRNKGKKQKGSQSTWPHPALHALVFSRKEDAYHETNINKYPTYFNANFSKFLLKAGLMGIRCKASHPPKVKD